MPLPLTPAMGLGMKVQCRPFFWATALSVVRKVMALSAVGSGRTIAKVDLALAHGDFVVRRLHTDAQRLQRIDHLATHAVGQIRADVEVAGLIVGDQRQEAAVRVTTEEEEFQLRADLVAQPHLFGAFDLALQHIARIAVKGLSRPAYRHRRSHVPLTDPSPRG